MNDNVLANDQDIEVLITSKELVSELGINETEDKSELSENSSSSDHQKTTYDLYRKYRKKSSEKKIRKKKRKKRKVKNVAIPYYPLTEPFPQVVGRIFSDECSKRAGNHIPPSMLFPSRYTSFFLFGKTPTGESVGKDHGDDGHIAVFGGSGSGKTTGIAIPSLCTWKGTIFSFDFKGDLLRYALKRRNAKILYFLRGRKNRYWLDPYYLLSEEGEDNLVQNARELAHAIIPLPREIREPCWIMAARDILTGAIVYYFKQGIGFIDTMIEVKTTKITDLLEKFNDDKLAKICINPNLNLTPKTLAGISLELHIHITVFVTDPLIQDVLSPSEDGHKEQIRWEDLDTGDVFIRIDQSRIDQWGGVMRLILVQLIRTLERRPEKYEPAGRRIPPTLLMLDEFPQYGKIEVITSALKILRSKNVTISLFCQSLADLDETYGKDTRRTILDNCPYKAILGASDAETQHYFSDLVGTVKVPSKGVTANFDELGYPFGYSVSVNESREPIIHPHEFASLEDIVLLHPGPERFCRVEKETCFRKNLYPEPIEEGDKDYVHKT